MTPLRVTLAAVAAALTGLALGIAIGAGPLQPDVRDAFAAAATAGDDPQASVPDTAPVDPRRSRLLAYDDAFTTEVAPRLLADRLAGRGVLLLATPDADPEAVDGLASRIAEAGGQVTTRLKLGTELLDPAARNLVDSLTTQLQPTFPDLELAPSTEVYDRTGALLARTLLTGQNAGEQFDEPARSVLSSFTTAGLVSGSEPSRRASAVVLVTDADRRRGGIADEGMLAQARAEIVAAVLRGLDAGSDGAVLAAPAAAQPPPGAVTLVRDPNGDSGVSSVTAVEQTSGQVAVVLAVVEQLTGESGHYGVDAPDGTLPPLD